jgi:two-component system sensor histidine kinase SenX3
MAGVAAGLVAGVLLGGLGAVAVARVRRRSDSRQGAWPPKAGRAGVEVYRSVLDALEVGVLVLDADGRLLLANPAAGELGILTTVGGVAQANAVVRTLAAQVGAAGEPRTMELDLPGSRRASPGRRGGLSAVNVHGVPLGGQYVAIEIADITEAHRLARVRRDFVANVSHELKTPVGALRLLAEALIEATEDIPEDATDVVAVRRFAERIKHESRRLGRLVGDLIELTRLQGAEPLPEPEQVAVDTVIAEVIDRTRTPAAAKTIEVAVDGERGLVTYGNEGQLLTAMANLVENAIAYSPELTTVTITTTAADDTVRISVADEGIGIEPKDIGRIFERFYRADKARSRVTGGTGLGLAIVKHIATNHGGRVEVASTVGAGSTFTLQLPAGPPDTSTRQPRTDEIGSAAADQGTQEARA